MWMFLFMILPLLAVIYIGWHVWAILPFSQIWKTVAVLLMASCFLLFFFGLRRQTDNYSSPSLAKDKGIKTSTQSNTSRTKIPFLCIKDSNSSTNILKNNTNINLVFLFVVFLYGNIHYYNKVRVPLELTSSKPLPKDYRVVMVSDLHLGYHNPRKELARWVDMMNAEKPDFILIAGDLIDGSIRPLNEERMAEEFHRLTAPVYACLGNHEYFGGDANARQFYKDAGIRLLIDEAAVIDSAIVVIGRDDRSNRRRKSVEDLVKSATSHISPLSPQISNLKSQISNLYTIVLDHQPYELEKVEAAGADFQLSGHTHRGQVWPISWITDAIYECSWGSHQRGNTQFYISSGLGLWGGKFRIGTQSEYVVATLSQKSQLQK